jgi:hypothetical protein
MITQKYLDKLILESLKKKKEEAKEVTGTGGGYGYSAPAFSMFSKDDVARGEYKRKPKIVRETDTCPDCGESNEDCTCPQKVEATEATTSASVGPYDANSFQDINMRGSTTKGVGSSWKKTQLPGGSFVSVKEKCKTFPYCNQGDIKALNISKPKTKKSKLTEAIKNVSIKTGLSVEEIENIILSKIDGIL